MDATHGVPQGTKERIFMFSNKNVTRSAVFIFPAITRFFLYFFIDSNGGLRTGKVFLPIAGLFLPIAGLFLPIAGLIPFSFVVFPRAIFGTGTRKRGRKKSCQTSSSTIAS